MIGLKSWHKKHDIYFFITGAVVGSIGEIVCIHFGVWQYANSTFLGIPMWLPLVWGLATILIKRISEMFVKIEMK
jgi:ubiquinone biosynthesis protein Coq4